MAQSRGRRRVRQGVAICGLGLALGAVAACSSQGDSLPPTGTSSHGVREVLVRVPQSRLAELFPEGSGLLFPVRDMSPAGQWWQARLPEPTLESLSALGIEWRPLTTSLLGGKENSPGETCSGSPDPNTFCPYAEHSSRVSFCNQNILQELDAAASNYPPIGGTPYVETVYFGDSYEGRPMKAVRIGKLHRPGDPPVPQYVVYAAQHSREWVGPEMAMRLFRYLADSFRDDVDDVRKLLQDVAIVIVPVSNPDGYDYTHTSVDREWRPNRQPCTSGIGTDINRNDTATFYEPGSGTSCLNSLNSTYRGPYPTSAPESMPLLSLFASSMDDGAYRTRFALNVHSYGNALLFPEGISPGSSGLTPCTTNSNCSAPDLGAFYDLMGTERAPTMKDEESGRPYISGQTYRLLYSIAGDSVTEHVYGELPMDADQFLGAGIEMTYTGCGFEAESLPSAQLKDLFDNFLELNRRILNAAPKLNDGSYFRDFSLPHLHRRQPDGTAGEYPTLRVAARKHLTGVDFLVPGGTADVDDVRDGVEYRMYRWRPTGDPYTFPTLIPLCADGKNCSPIAMGDPGWGEINLCKPDLFPTRNGWTFKDDQPGGPQEECFWTFDPSGSGPYRLTSGEWSIANMHEAKLVYSIRWQSSVQARVLVSSNGFSGCSESGFGSCRVVRSYPFGTSNIDLRSDAYRTEILDIADFDHASKVQVRFEVTSGSGNMSVFDPVMIGWAG